MPPFPSRIKYEVDSAGNPEEYWIPPYQVRGKLNQARNDKNEKTNTNALNKMTSPPTHPSPLEGEGWVGGTRIYCVCISIAVHRFSDIWKFGFHLDFDI